MRHQLRRCAASAVVLTALPLTELVSPPVSRSEEPCGPGMYYNYQTLSCQPVVADWDVDPWIGVPIPYWNPIDVDLDADIDLGPPGGPGGIGPGRPGGIGPGAPARPNLPSRPGRGGRGRR